MPKTVSASEAKTRLGALVDWAVKTQDDVIIETYGAPKAVLISYEEYQRVRELREKARREEALASLQGLRDRISARNRDLSEDEVADLAERLADETVEALRGRGVVRFGG